MEAMNANAGQAATGAGSGPNLNEVIEDNWNIGRLSFVLGS
jgi:hypothetical protein